MYHVAQDIQKVRRKNYITHVTYALPSKITEAGFVLQ